MKSFFYCTLSRRSLSDIFFGDGVERLQISSLYSLSELPHTSLRGSDEVIAIWNHDPQMSFVLPCVLVCSDGSASDWTAWLTTYFAKLRPISALVRLMEQDEFEGTVNRLRDPRLDSALWPIVGLVIGEVMASSGISDRQLDALPLNAYESTLSFALFRSFAISGDTKDFVQITKSWETVRRTTNQHPRAIEAKTISKICEFVLRAGDWIKPDYPSNAEEFPLLSLCRSILDGTTDYRLEGEISRALDLSIHIEGTREDRVVAFTAFVERLSAMPMRKDNALISVVLGFLVSQVAPGTIQHASMLAPIVGQYPEALIWYGLCAGRGKQKANERGMASRAGSELPAVARWIARSILRPDSPWETPSCDISWRELVSLYRTGDDPISNIIRATQGSAIIELSPTVWTVINISAKTDAPENSRRARESRNENLLVVMQESLARLNKAFHELSSDQGIEPQQSLFAPKRRK